MQLQAFCKLFGIFCWGGKLLDETESALGRVTLVFTKTKRDTRSLWCPTWTGMVISSLSEFWGQGYRKWGWTPPPLNRYFCLLMGTAKHRDFHAGAVVLCIIAGTNKAFGKLNVGKLLFVRQQDRISPALLFRLSVLCDCFCFLYQMFLPKGIDVLKI